MSDYNITDLLSPAFLERMQKMLGDEYEDFIKSYEAPRTYGLRVNTAKISCEEFEKIVPFPVTPIPWIPNGYFYPGDVRPSFCPLYQAGLYYLQEPSAMTPASCLPVTPGENILDLCAAPGGKATALGAMLNGSGLLVANDISSSRTRALLRNIELFGIANAFVTNETPAHLKDRFPEFFHKILLDAPCSGEGMFRKDPVAVEEWSPENVEICWQRQRRIIADIWDALKPGGILIYSTCTFNTKEDEENARWIQQEYGGEPLTVQVQENWNITGDLLSDKGDHSKSSIPVYHFFPHKTKGEGFFLVAFRKPETEEEIPVSSSAKEKAFKKKDKKGTAASSPVSKEYLNMAKSWLNDENSDKYILLAEGTNIRAFSQYYTNELATMKQSLKIVSAGIEIGEVKGKDLIPNHALAMCTSLLCREAFATEEISYEQAITYLRKEAITLPVTAPRGYVLLTYRHIPLGFVKNIGNRANNLYPQEWRIRSGYLPENIRILSEYVTD